MSMYQDSCDTLASGIFAALVDGENLHNKISGTTVIPEQLLTHLLKRAFEVFDKEGKGCMNEADVGRVVAKVSPSDSKDL